MCRASESSANASTGVLTYATASPAASITTSLILWIFPGVIMRHQTLLTV